MEEDKSALSNEISLDKDCFVLGGSHKFMSATSHYRAKPFLDSSKFLCICLPHSPKPFPPSPAMLNCVISAVIPGALCTTSI